MEFILVYMTASSEAEARHIGRALVDERLAACVNILPGMQSIYRWQGRVESAAETVLLAKTRGALFDSLAERVRALHSFSCPCVVAWPLTNGAAAYLNWIDDSVATDLAPS